MTKNKGMGRPLDEQLFHEALGRIRWSTDRTDLADATRTTLGLLLRRPGDQALLTSLLAQADSVFLRNAEVRKAAVRCVVLLQSAKRGRLSRAQEAAREARKRRRRLMLLMGAAATAAACCGVVLGQP